jgi:hypothetical protein
MSDPETNEITCHGTSPTDNAPIEGQVLAGSAIYEQTKAQDRKKQRYKKLRHAAVWIEAACGILLVLITGIYTYFAAGQLRIMGRATKAAEDSANAARSAADTASNTLKFTQDSFRDEQRAWIGVPDLKIVSIPNPTTIDVFLHNSGRTPALHVRRATVYATRDQIIKGPSPRDIAVAEKKILKSGEIAIAPDETPTLRASDNDGYVAGKWTAIDAGQKFLYVYGIIGYTDVANRPHKTSFCYYLSHPRVPMSLSACEAFNSMD